MKKFIGNNKQLWEFLTKVNYESGYDVSTFIEGRCSLKSIELSEVGDVRGRSLLHLQCQFGMDSMSWARQGADVTGVDLSPKAIKLARELNSRLGLSVKFIESDIMELESNLEGQFDIVFTSYGVLCWIPDLRKWAQIIRRYLKPGGVFHMVEIHPFCNVFDNEPETKELRVCHSYFHKPEPTRWTGSVAYSDKNERTELPSYEWVHGMADIINSLISEGLSIEHINEFPFSVYDHFSFLKKCEDGWYRFKDSSETIPLLFSLKARKNTTH